MQVIRLHGSTQDTAQYFTFIENIKSISSFKIQKVTPKGGNVVGPMLAKSSANYTLSRWLDETAVGSLLII